MSKQFLPIFAVSLQSLLRKEGEHQRDYNKRLLCILKRVNGDDSDDIESSGPIGALICNLKSEVNDWAKEARAIVENDPSSPFEALITELLQSRKRCVSVEDLPIVKDFTDEKEFVRAFISSNDSETSSEVVNTLIDAVVVSDDFKKKIVESTEGGLSEDGSEAKDKNSFSLEKVHSLTELLIDDNERLQGKRAPECWNPLNAYTSTKTEGYATSVIRQKLSNIFKYSRNLVLIDDYLDFRPAFTDQNSDFSQFNKIIDLVAVQGAHKKVTLVKQNIFDLENPNNRGTSHHAKLCGIVSEKVDVKKVWNRKIGEQADGSAVFETTYAQKNIENFYCRMRDCIGEERLGGGGFFLDFKIKIVDELHKRGTHSPFAYIVDQDGFADKTKKGFRTLTPMSLVDFNGEWAWDNNGGNVLMEIDMKKAVISFVRGSGNTEISIF
jgi:hypothetical protein